MKMEINTDEEIHATSSWSDFTKKTWNCLVKNTFLVKIQGAVLLGVALGWTLKSYGLVDSDIQLYVGFPGVVLMRMLKVLTVPLIVTSVIMGVSGLSVKSSRKIALRTAAYILCTTIIAVIIGITLVVMIKPGVAHAVNQEEIGTIEEDTTIDTLMDLVRNMVPHNLIQACFEHFKTDRTEIKIEDYDYINGSVMTNETHNRKQGHYVSGANTMGLIVWSFVFGLVLNKMGGKGEILVEVFAVINETTKTLVKVIMSYLPVGVMFMIASNVLDIDEWETIFKLGKFVFTVMTGLLIQAVIVLPLIYFLFTRCSPMAVIRGVSPALMTALAISSSSATQPITLRCCEERLKIDQRITRFILPIGTSLNMNGSAIYEVVAAVFIAQLNGMHLNFAHLLTIAVTAAVASTGAALPATGAVTTLIVLAAVGIPAKEASTLVVVEWLIDRCNTVINVMGNCYGASLIYRVSTQELELMTRRDAANLENVQVNVSSQASDNDIFHSDVSENEDIELQVLRTPSECLSAQDRDEENM
ncbi:excitatory amino acid transporter 3-like isoform X1 [Etheostoma cragini]|uniref:excitatory amino acid transporter 3-like isoform X1 n=1 Tax=Etheostoma cragini TaxID=417921 RepID=UPI00155EACA1|nr:excitatory amino acid transporter 3-like isoform X1 [Etheostoma cragini]